jgi:hypothetical protein
VWGSLRARFSTAELTLAVPPNAAFALEPTSCAGASGAAHLDTAAGEAEGASHWAVDSRRGRGAEQGRALTPILLASTPQQDERQGQHGPLGVWAPSDAARLGVAQAALLHWGAPFRRFEAEVPRALLPPLDTPGPAPADMAPAAGLTPDVVPGDLLLRQRSELDHGALDLRAAVDAIARLLSEASLEAQARCTMRVVSSGSDAEAARGGHAGGSVWAGFSSFLRQNTAARQQRIGAEAELRPKRIASDETEEEQWAHAASAASPYSSRPEPAVHKQPQNALALASDVKRQVAEEAELLQDHELAPWLLLSASNNKGDAARAGIRAGIDSLYGSEDDDPELTVLQGVRVPQPHSWLRLEGAPSSARSSDVPPSPVPAAAGALPPPVPDHVLADVVAGLRLGTLPANALVAPWRYSGGTGGSAEGGPGSGCGIVIPIALPLHCIAIELRGPGDSVAVPAALRGALGVALGLGGGEACDAVPAAPATVAAASSPTSRAPSSSLGTGPAMPSSSSVGVSQSETAGAGARAEGAQVAPAAAPAAVAAAAATPSCMPTLSAMMRTALLAADGWTVVTLHYSELPWVVAVHSSGDDGDAARAAAGGAPGGLRVVLDESPAGRAALARLLQLRLPANLVVPPSPQSTPPSRPPPPPAAAQTSSGLPSLRPRPGVQRAQAAGAGGVRQWR